MSEIQERLAFLMERDGEEKALEWAKMSLAAYIEATVERSQYKEQIDGLATFICEDGTQIDWVKITPPPQEKP